MLIAPRIVATTEIIRTLVEEPPRIIRVLIEGPPGPSGDVSAPYVAQGGVTWRTSSERWGRDLTLLDFGYDADRLVDFSSAFAAALASGARLSGNGLDYYINGSFQHSGGPLYLKDMGLIQLGSANPDVRTLWKTGRGPLVLKRVKIDRNAQPDQGSLTQPAAALYVNGINYVYTEDLEITGDGIGLGISINNCGVCHHVRPHLHDMHWWRATDPGSEQIGAFGHFRCTDVTIDDPNIYNLTGQIASDPIRALGTDGIDVSSCNHFHLRGGVIENCTEGVDITGGNPAHNLSPKIDGTTFRNCYGYGLKLIHGIRDGVAVNVSAYDCGLAGIIVASGGTVAVPEGTILDNCACVDTGSIWGGDPSVVIAGIALQSGGGIHPLNTIIKNPRIRNRPEYEPSQWIAPYNRRYYTDLATSITRSYEAALNEWLADHDYAVGDVITFRCCYYHCLTAHHSTASFRADQKAGLWVRGILTPTADSGQTWRTGAPNHASGTELDNAKIPWTYLGEGDAPARTMEYGIRGEPPLDQVRIINPLIDGFTLDAYTSIFGGIETTPIGVMVPGALRISGNFLGDREILTPHVIVPQLFKRRRNLWLLVAGQNDDVAAPTHSVMDIVIDPPLGPFSITGIQRPPTDGVPGIQSQIRVKYNGTETCTLLHANVASPADHRLRIFGGGNLVLVAPFYFDIEYDDQIGFWDVLAWLDSAP